MSKNISYKVRMGLVVATAVAEEIVNNLSRRKLFCSKNYGIRPVLLSITTSLKYRFEGGIVVEVNLYDYRQENGEKAENWWVKSVKARFYSGEPTKTKKVFDAFELNQIRQVRPWHTPRILTTGNTRFKIGAFHNPLPTEGELYFAGLDIYPYDRMRNSHFQLVCEIPFDPNIDGDEDQAATKAIRIYGITRGVSTPK